MIPKYLCIFCISFMKHFVVLHGFGRKFLETQTRATLWCRSVFFGVSMWQRNISRYEDSRTCFIPDVSRMPCFQVQEWIECSGSWCHAQGWDAEEKGWHQMRFDHWRSLDHDPILVDAQGLGSQSIRQNHVSFLPSWMHVKTCKVQGAIVQMFHLVRSNNSVYALKAACFHKMSRKGVLIEVAGRPKPSLPTFYVWLNSKSDTRRGPKSVLESSMGSSVKKWHIPMTAHQMTFEGKHPFGGIDIR